MKRKNTCVRSGPALASRSETGRRSRTSGRDSRTNGRMLLRSCGAASLANGRTASLAGASARAAGRSFWVVGPSSSANVSTRPERVGGLPQRARQLADRGGDVGLLLGRTSRTPRTTSRRGSARSSSRDASSLESTFSEVIRCRSCLRRVATAPLTRARSRWVGSKRASRSRRSPPRPSSPRPTPLTSSCRYSRVSVSSTASTSSGLTSGCVARTGIVNPCLATGASPPPGCRSMNMSFSPVFGRSSAVALVWTRSLYSRSMSIWITARPSLSSTPPMSPMRTPDDAHGLALAGHDGLGGRELGVEPVRLRLEERDPQPLLLEDVERTRRRRSTIRTMIAAKSPRFLRIAVTCRSPPSFLMSSSPWSSVLGRRPCACRRGPRARATAS